MGNAATCFVGAIVATLAVASPGFALATNDAFVTANSARIQHALELAAAATRAAAPLTEVEADRWRIQQHLARVEARLRGEPVSHLSPELRRARETNLEVLHSYWTAGRFPRNTQHPGEARPYFIDDQGTACAVAHLLATTGSPALARQVDRRLHNAYVPEMDNPELAAWAARSGLSIDELALIQPEYCLCGGGEGGADGAGEQSYEPVCGADGLTYWNECAANLCAQVPVAHAGECDEPALRCETCGVDSRLPVVAECAESPGEETTVGVCQRSGGDDVVPVNLVIAERWLELQNAECPADADYAGIFPRSNEFGRPWQGLDEIWDCTSPGGSSASAGAPATEGGAPSGGTGPLPNPERGDDSGCALTPVRAGWTGPWLAGLALAGLARRLRRARSA